MRANSFAPEPIAPADHQRWFQAGLAAANRLLLIARDTQGCPLGQIRFDRQPPAHAQSPREALIGLSLDRCARGQGLATELVRMGLQAMEQHWGPATEAVAEVLAGNAASQATFAKAGFSLDRIPAIPPPASACDALALAPSPTPCAGSTTPPNWPQAMCAPAAELRPSAQHRAAGATRSTRW